MFGEDTLNMYNQVVDDLKKAYKEIDDLKQELQQTINGKFSETQLGQEILELIEENNMTKEELRKSLDFVNEERERLQQELEEEKRINQEDLKYIDELNERIEKAVEYINHLSKEPNVFGHYGIHNDCAKWLLNILNGRSDE